MDARSLLEAETLFGWPIGTIDELVELRRQAYEDEISIVGWRSRDRELRAPLPPLSDEELDAMKSLQRELARGGADDDASALLERRLGTMLNPAPDNTELRSTMSRSKHLAGSADPDRQVFLSERTARFSRWLRESDDNLDDVTGLPWAFIYRFRTVNHPKLGSTHQHVWAARRQALEQASQEQLEGRSMDGNPSYGRPPLLRTWRGRS